MNHYAIYELLDKFVTFKIQSQKRPIEGIVTEVYRDPIKHQIEVTLGTERKYVFPEPDSILHDDDVVILVYGKQTDESDDAFFEELRRISSQGMGADEAFKALESPSTAIRFILKEPPKTSGKSRRNPRRGKRKKTSKSLVDSGSKRVKKVERGKKVALKRKRKTTKKGKRK